MLGCGAPTHFPSPFPTSSLLPPHPNTLSYTSSHTSSHISTSSPHTPTHFSTPIPHLPSPSQSVAKLPCDEVSVAKLLWKLAKLPCGEVTGNHNRKCLDYYTSTNLLMVDSSHSLTFSTNISSLTV